MKKKIVYTDFQDVSIRGRVAFFSSYLEKIILTKNRRLEDWEVLLTEIWQYTLSDRLDNWHEKMSEYLPESILEDIPFKEKEIVYLSYKDYAYLQILYRNAEEEILYLIKQIFYIGTIELYGGIGEKGFQSLLIIKEVLEYIKYPCCRQAIHFGHTHVH